MAKARVEFEKKFKMMWAAGPTGCSVFYTTTET